MTRTSVVMQIACLLFLCCCVEAGLFSFFGKTSGDPFHQELNQAAEPRQEQRRLRMRRELKQQDVEVEDKTLEAATTTTTTTTSTIGTLQSKVSAAELAALLGEEDDLVFEAVSVTGMQRSAKLIQAPTPAKVVKPTKSSSATKLDADTVQLVADKNTDKNGTASITTTSAKTSAAETPVNASTTNKTKDSTTNKTKDREARPSRKGSANWGVLQEGHLIDSLTHLGGSAGEEAVGCVTACRFGEVRHTWKECINRCVENRLMRSTFMSMLPAEKHEVHAAHVEMPENIRMSEETKAKYLQHKRQRSAEL